MNKRTSLFPFLLVFLVLGYFIFQAQSQNKIEEYGIILESEKNNIQEAENYLLLTNNTPGAKDKANALLMESWQTLFPIFEKIDSLPDDFAKELLDAKKNISDRLYELNNFAVIENPEVFFQFEEYAPYKMASFNNNLYFVYSKKLLELKGKDLGTISSNNNLDLAAAADNLLLLFSKPNVLLALENGSIAEKQYLESPYADYDFSDLAVYSNNLYFLDKNKSKVVKYSYSNNAWSSPQLWAEEQDSFESISIDGSVWLLSENNEIKRYYGGKAQQTITLDIFPEVRDLAQVFTSSATPYLYLTEPSQKRIIVLDKNGNVVRQFQSESFDNILGLFGQGKTIYLLSGSKVYKISF